MSSSRCQDLRTVRITGMQCLGVNLFCPWTRTAREHTHTHRQTQTCTRTHTRTRPHNFQDTCLAGAARPKLVEDEDHACFGISMKNMKNVTCTWQTCRLQVHFHGKTGWAFVGPGHPVCPWAPCNCIVVKVSSVQKSMDPRFRTWKDARPDMSTESAMFVACTAELHKHTNTLRSRMAILRRPPHRADSSNDSYSKACNSI